MAYYYKVNDSKDVVPPYKGFHLQRVKKLMPPGPKINYDFSKHVLVELLDDVTPESQLWSEMGLTNNKSIVHKRMIIDSHRIKCRRAIIICISPDEAKVLAQKLSQTKVMSRCICAVVIQDLLSDLCLFEKQVIQFGDNRSQHHLLYVSDLSRSRGPSGLTQFLKNKFSPFGTILSVLVCSDDDDYAFPEGVIKFAYLSEAFAAELAFDQFVVSKERLSVTTHHNILLSQCDLRLRLRDAQRCCNVDNNKSSEFLFNSFNQSYRLNNLETVNEFIDSSMSHLHISNIYNLQKCEGNSTYDSLDNTIPAFSQRNLHKNSDFEKTVLCVKKKNNGKEQNVSNVALSAHETSLKSYNNSEALNINSKINLSPQQNGLHASKTAPWDMSATKIIDYVPKSQIHESRSIKNIAPDNFLNVGSKSFKNNSDCGSFKTCNSANPTSDILFFSPKKSSYKSFHSQRTDSVLEYQSQSSNCPELQSPIGKKLNDLEVIKESLPKHSKKRKKKFTPSQKLCLKSQRSCLSQNSVLNENIQIPETVSSVKDTNVKHKHLALKRNFNLLPNASDKNGEFSQSSKVADWLSHLPITSIQTEELVTKEGELESSKVSKTTDCSLYQPLTSTQIDELSLNNEKLESSKLSNIGVSLMHLPKINVEALKVSSKRKAKMAAEFREKNKQYRSRISVHKTPALKSSEIPSDYETQYNDNDSTENDDPNKMPPISSSNHSDSIPLTDDYNSPLQMWLKQELVSSTNNSVYESKESSKSAILCAMKNKDIIISVGCSHMTCEVCYPESNDLLLGYS